MSSVRTRVASSDWWASRIVVSVIEDGFVGFHPARQSRGPLEVEELLQAGSGAVPRTSGALGAWRRASAAHHLGVAVDDDVGDELQ